MFAVEDQLYISGHNLEIRQNLLREYGQHLSKHKFLKLKKIIDLTDRWF